VIQIGQILDQGDMALQQPQRPAGEALGRGRAGQRDQPGLDLAGHDRGHRWCLARFTADRGQHVAVGVGEPLRDRTHGVLRGPDPTRDHRPIGHRAGVLVQLQQHPRPHDHPRRMGTGRGQLDQELTIGSRQTDHEHLRARHRAGILSAAEVNC
jgi:hypothetical protein